MANPVRLLLRRPAYRRLAGAGQLANLTQGMLPLALPLLTAATVGSYRLGGLLVTVIVLAQIALAAPAGRFLDRVGVGRGLPALLAVGAAGYLLLAVLAPAANRIGLVLLAVPLAAAGAGTSGGVRTLLARTVPATELPAALSLNATLIEIDLVVGPLLVLGLHALGASAPVAGLAATTALAALLLPRTGAEPVANTVHSGQSLWNGRLVGWLLGLLALGGVFGSIEVGALPRAHVLHGGAGAAAVLLTTLSVFSALAGAVYAAISHRWTAPTRPLMAVFGAGGLLLALGPGWPAALAGVVLVGSCAAPTLASISIALQELLPEGRRAEGFSLTFSAQGLGYALGSLAVAGLPIAAAQTIPAVATVLVAALGTGGAVGRALHSPLTHPQPRDDHADAPAMTGVSA